MGPKCYSENSICNTLETTKFIQTICFLFEVVAATQDNTTVHVNLRKKELVSPFVLNRGEAFQYLSDSKYRQTSLGKQCHTF